MKWISTKKALPDIVATDIYDFCTVEYSDYVLIYRRVLGINKYHVARLERAMFDDENVTLLWQAEDGTKRFDAETVYYWAEIVKPESEVSG